MKEERNQPGLDEGTKQKIAETADILKSVPFAMRFDIVKSIESNFDEAELPEQANLNNKRGIPTYPKGVEEMLLANPSMLDKFTAEFKSSLKNQVRELQTKLFNYDRTIPKITSLIDEAIQSGNFNPAKAGGHTVYKLLSTLDEARNNKSLKNQVINLEKALMKADENPKTLTEELTKGVDLDFNISKSYGQAVDIATHIHDRYEVEMGSTQTGTPNQPRGNPAREDAPELYGTKGLTSPGTREGTLSLDDIAKIREKHKGAFGHGKEADAKAPSAEVKQTIVNLDKAVNWIIDKPENAQDFMKTRDSSQSAELINFAIKIQDAMRDEMQVNGRSDKASQLSNFYEDVVKDKAVSAVIDKLHNLQSEKQNPFMQCTGFLKGLDESLLRSVAKKLEGNKEKIPGPKQPRMLGKKVLGFKTTKVSLSEMVKKTQQEKVNELRAETQAVLKK